VTARLSAGRTLYERGGLVTHETQCFGDPFPAAPGRAALTEPIPADEP
jgi:hypothetical protein